MTTKLSGDVSTDISAYDLEFKSSDDAWYSVRVVLDGDTLILKLWEFSGKYDKRFNAGDFETLEAVDEFCRRFRPISEQCQDNQCSSIIEGMTVCASYSSIDDDIRFYDAVVEAVHNEKHSFVKKEEVCSCTFVLFWQHGPKEGTLTSVNIANICIVRSGAQVDPRVVTFSKLAKEQIKIASLTCSSVSGSGISLCKGPTCDKENCGLSIKEESSSSQYRFWEMESAGQFDSVIGTTEGRLGKCCQQSDHDRDLGGKSFYVSSIEEAGDHHFILIENLEKDLSPTSIMEFMHKQTSISPQVYVFPSLSSESYTRGAIVLDSKKKLTKIYEFLNNLDHVIMSSRGRPWVITEKVLRCGTFRTTLGNLMPNSQSNSQNKNIDNELKVVHSGTEEYRSAKRRRDLFIDFMDHQQRLHKRLALEERRILQPSHAV